MGFQCVCSVDVDEYVEIIESKTYIARKEHGCHECGEIIKKGDKYLVEKETFNGVFSTHKTCGPCHEVRNAFMDQWYLGQIWNDLRDCMDDVSLPDFEKFSAAAQAKILEML